MKFFSQKNKNYLIVDVGGSQISAAIVNNDFKKNNLCPEITTQFSSPVDYGNPVDFQFYKRNLKKNLNEILTKIYKQKNANFTKTICLLPSLLSHNTILNIRYEETREFNITPKLINKIVEKNIRDWLRSDMFSTGQYRLMDSSILSMKLNGYPTNNPYDKKASQLEMTLYASVAEESIVNLFEEIFNKNQPDLKIFFSTSTLAHYRVISNLLPNQSNYLYLDTSGELCDIVYVAKDTAKIHLSFPLGSNTLLRHIIDTLGTVKSHAQSTLTLYATESLPIKEANIVNPALSSIKKDWDKNLRASLVHLSEHEPLPEQIFVLNDEPQAEIFANWIKNSDFSDLTLGGHTFKVNLINRKTLSPLCLGLTTNKNQVNLAIASLFAEYVGG